jgi:hypothetical protein
VEMMAAMNAIRAMGTKLTVRSSNREGKTVNYD